MQPTEKQPLAGQRILLLRATHQAVETRQILEQLGAAVVCEAAFEIREPVDWSPVDRAIESISQWEWILFTSRNGVDAFMRRADELGQDLEEIATTKYAAIGASTADSLKVRGLTPAFIAENAKSEELVEQIRPLVSGQGVLLVRADRGREIIERELATSCQNFESIAVYRQVDRAAPSAATLAELRAGNFDWVFISSGNMARVFSRWLDESAKQAVLEKISICAISPLTAQAIEELGLQVRTTATEFTYDGMIRAVIETLG